MLRQYIIILISVLVIIAIMFSIPIESGMYRLLSTVNAILSTAALFLHRRCAYSIHKIVNLFILLFFVVANAIQYSTHTNVSSLTVSLTSNDYENFQIIVLLILILFNFLYSYYFINNRSSFKIIVDPVFSNRNLIVLSTVSFVITIIYYYSFSNIQLLFVRGILEGVDDSPYESSGIMQGLIIDKTVRSVPYACYAFSYIGRASKKVRMYLLVVMLITLFPPSLARNAVAMYWLPVLLLNYKIFRMENFFVLSMLFGILVIFPFFDVFRYWNDEVSYSYSLDFLNSMHFDASQEFMIAMKKDNIVSWGYQLLGVMLFFVPRSIWPDKPLSSGAYIANTESGTFSNISMPFWGEGYVNFGYIGIFVFVLFGAWLSSTIDRKYWRNPQGRLSFSPYYFLLLGATIFVMRGDLMSSYAYTVGILVTSWGVEKCCKNKAEMQSVSR